MMALMRKFINNRAYKYTMWAFLAMMVGGSLLLNVGHEKEWALKVYDEIMSREDFEKIIHRKRQEKESYRQKNIIINGKNPEKEAVTSAVTSLLGEHAMEALSMSVPSHIIEKRLGSELSQLPSYFFYEDGSLNVPMLEKLIAPQSMEDFIDGMHKDEKNSLFFSIVDLGLYVPQFELSLQFNSDFAKKDYSIVSMPLQKFIAEAKKIEPSVSELAKFYKKPANSDQFKTAEKRAGVAWSFDQDGYGVKISDKEVKEDYDKNKSKYQEAASQMQIRTLLVKTEVGKEDEAKSKIEGLKQESDQDQSKFAELVKKFSDDKETASKGGLSGMFDQDSKGFDKIVVKTAFEALSKDGDIAGPIKTDKGYVLIQRVKRDPAKYKELKAVESDIKKDLSASKFKKRFKQDAARAISQASYEPEILENFIKKYNGKKKEISLDSRKGGADASNLFKTNEGKYTTFFDKDIGMLLKCTDVVASKLPELSDIKSLLLPKYHEAKGKELIQIELNKLETEVRSGSFGKMAEENKLKVQKASFEYKDGRVEKSPAIRGQEIEAKLKGLHMPGGVVSVETAQEGLLIRLDNIERNDTSLFEEKKKHLNDTLFYSKKYQVKEGFIASLYRHAKLDNKIEMKSELTQYAKEK